jgi:hypothetical protein
MIAELHAHAIAVVLQQQATLQAVIERNNALASAASVALQSSISNLVQNGASGSLLATGTYSYAALDISSDASLPKLTNEQCSLFMSAIKSQAALKAQLSTEMAQVLPLPASGIVFGSSNITCKSFTTLGTKGDQRAVLLINELKLTTMYTMFAKGASYVVLASAGADTSQQPLELFAPLSLQTVQAALQDALWRVFLETLMSYYGVFDAVQRH